MYWRCLTASFAVAAVVAGFFWYQVILWSHPEMTSRQLFLARPLPYVVSNLAITAGCIVLWWAVGRSKKGRNK